MNIFDHSRAVREVMQAGIDVCASEGTLKALGIIDENRRTQILMPYCAIDIGDSFYVFPFLLNHDSVMPLGFVIRDSETKEDLLFAPDTSHITQHFRIQFSIIAIECSYDKDILQRRVDSSDIDETIAKRLLTSHMEKRTTMRYLDEFCDLSKCREIHLLHMSEGNIDKEQTKKEFEQKFFIDVFI